VTIGEPGTIVGAFETAHFSESATTLGPGDSLFLYTDGVTEARRAGVFFGEERLLEALAVPGTTTEVVQHVLDRVLEFQHQVPGDDIALLAVRATD
jgi:sigma-B regulation protein RsbU (phosphoserine phosphatase)